MKPKGWNQSNAMQELQKLLPIFYSIYFIRIAVDGLMHLIFRPFGTELAPGPVIPESFVTSIAGAIFFVWLWKLIRLKLEAEN